MSGEILQWVAAWVIFIIAQSFFISGAFIAAYGETEKMPNGKDKDSPMILYPIYKYLTHSHHISVFYREFQLLDLLNKLDREFRNIWSKKYKIIDGEYIIFDTKEDFDISVGAARKLEPQEIFFGYDEDQRKMFFYKKYPKFRFNKWIRMPIVGCYKCMPSYWSLLSYWVPMLLVFGFHYWEFLLWIANVPSVTLFNSILHKQYK